MRRQSGSDEYELPGQDSFLDIMANMVGILIMLVMIVGLRSAFNARQGRSTSPAVEVLATADQVHELEHSHASLRSSTIKSIATAMHLHEQAELRDDERIRKATYVAAFRQEVEQRRDALGAQQRRDFELSRQLAEAQYDLDRLTREQVGQMMEEPSTVTKLENQPTPIGREVEGEEVIVRLASGRASVVPFQQLRDEFSRIDVRNLVRLAGRANAGGVVGPVDGYRMHYTILQKKLRAPDGSEVVAPFPLCEYKPIDERFGEPVAEAIAEGSLLWSRLQRFDRRSTTITICVYPDSFDVYRELRDALYSRGYSTAARPLPAGVTIASSPFGSKSVAQ